MGSRHAGIRGWAFLLASSGLGLGLVSLAMAATGRAATHKESDSALLYSSHLASLAGDSSHGSGSPATATPTQTASAAATATATSTPPGQTCSSGHGALLGFSDAGVGSITRTPLVTTIGALRSLPQPSPFPSLSDATRLAPFETTVYSVTANLVSMSQLRDGTIVLLIGDNAGEATVPVFLPPRSCTSAAEPSDQGAISGDFNALRIACGDPPAVGAGPQALAGSATITGPGFWNSAKIDGAPANGASLGPVLSFSFSGASCDPSMVTPTPTPSPTPTVQTTYIGIVGATTSNAYSVGSPIRVQASIVPAASGVSCSLSYHGPPPYVIRLQGPTFETAADGSTPVWSFTIPADSVVGDAQAIADCGGRPATTTIHVTAAT